MTKPQDPQADADDIDPERAAQAEHALAAKEAGAKPQPHPESRTANEGMNAHDENREAQRQGSAKIGGQPEALGRSHGVRQSDQG